MSNIQKGYFIAICQNESDGYIPDALHIERDDALNLYESDKEAAKAAEWDGVKLIYGMAGVEDGVYIDTPENRLILVNAVLKQNKFIDIK